MKLAVPDTARLRGFLSLCVELVCLLVFLSNSAWSECLPNPAPSQQDSYFTACSADTYYMYNITHTIAGPSAIFCGNLCLADTSCKSFNVLNEGSGDMCELSRDEINECSTLDYRTGSTAYTVRPVRGLCSDSWRVALKTELDSVVTGSLYDLQEAVLSGAKVRIMWEPYPQSPDENHYKGLIYVVDSIKVQDSAPHLTAHIYAYFQHNMNDQPTWMHIKIESSGTMVTTLSTAETNTYDSNSLTWLVQSMTSECYQQVALSHKRPVGRPALVVEDTGRTGELSDLLTVLDKGCTARVVSHYGTDGILAYPTFPISLIKSANYFTSSSAWLPGDDSSGTLLPLRFNMFNFSSQAPIVETFVEIRTSDVSTVDGITKDPALTKTELFVDPCWEMKWSIDEDGGHLEGSKDSLLSALNSGARLLFVLTLGSFQMSCESERVKIFNDGFFIAYSKMGYGSGDGTARFLIRVDSDYDLFIGGEPLGTSGPLTFYTDSHQRPFRFKIEHGSETEGTWGETRERLKSGLIPRALLQISSSQWYLLDVEAAQVAHAPENTSFQSYREPFGNDMTVYFFSLNRYMRADVGLYRGHGENKISAYTSFEAITLFFEN